jgi:hypothetical protein
MAQKCRAFCTKNRLQLTVHPAYSPDLAPSDIFLLGHVKRCLYGIDFPSHNELLTAIHEIVPLSRSVPYVMCLTTGWKDSNGFLKTMVIIIHKVKIG